MNIKRILTVVRRWTKRPDPSHRLPKNIQQKIEWWGAEIQRLFAYLFIVLGCRHLPLEHHGNCVYKKFRCFL